MIKHKKILKGFDFPKLVTAAIKKHPDLGKRIERFNLWSVWHKSKCNFFSEKLFWNKSKYCFDFHSNFYCESKNNELGLNTTESTNKYIGNYLYNDSIRNWYKYK